MPSQYRRPGVYIEESLLLNPTDVAGTTTVAAFVGHAPKGPVNIPYFIESWSDYVTIFGDFDSIPGTTTIPSLDITATALLKGAAPVNYINLATLKADSAAAVVGPPAVPAGIGDAKYAGPAFTAGQYVTLLDGSKASCTGTGPASIWAAGPFTGTPPGGSAPTTAKDTLSYLPFAVYSFFQNGGHFAWVVRSVKAASVTGRTAAATVGSNTADAGVGEPMFKINAISSGKWGNDLAYRLVTPDPTGAPKVFTLEIMAVSSVTGQAPVTYERVERFDNLSILGAIPGTRRVDSAVNEVIGSRYVRITNLAITPVNSDGLADPVGTAVNETPFPVDTPKALTGGNDPEPPLSADLKSACGYLSGIEGPMNVNIAGYLSDAAYLNNPGDAPGGTFVSNFFSPSAFTEREDVMSINDNCPARATGATGYATVMKGTSALAVDSPSSYTASYGPWILIPHPTQIGGVIPIPPGGAVLGTIARIDATIGYHRAPAGTIATVANAVGVQAKFTDAELGDLNYANINVLRPVVGSGICIMGARTRKNYGPDHYVSARRTLINVKEQLRRSTQWAVFENNDERLWSSLRITADAILRPLWERGGLRGSSAAEAYYVRCDETLNPIQVIALGEVRMEVGVALQYPAEFVIIKITQITASNFTNEIQVV